MIAAHRLSAEIAKLHGIPGKKERRRELQHQLIDVQARIPDEMSLISHEMDLKEVVENAQGALTNASFLEKLFVFPTPTRSADPAVPLRSPLASTRQHPLS